MEQITIGFSKPKTWKAFAWLIMKGYNIPYDHVYIKFHSDSYERDLIYQASGLAVNFMSTAIFDSNNVVVKEFTFDITPENKKAMVQFAIDNVGKPYGMKDCLGLAWVRICEIFGKKVKNPFSDNEQTWVCCELGTYVLDKFVGVQVPENAGDINPKQLYDYLTTINGG